MMSPPPSSDADHIIDTNERPQQVLRLRWNGDEDTSGDEEECTLVVARLRQHCLSETARTLRPTLGTDTDIEHPGHVLWGKGVLSSTTGNGLPSFEFKDIVEEDDESSSASSSSSKTAMAQLRDVVSSHGIARVRGVPIDDAGTETLGLKFCGYLMGSMHSKGLWAVSTGDISSDTLYRQLAFTVDALPLHTDHVAYAQPPWLEVRQNVDPCIDIYIYI